MKQFDFSRRYCGELASDGPHVAIPEGLPIVFYDDGRPCSLINDYMRFLDNDGVGRTSWSGYATAVRQFGQFLNEQPTPLDLDAPAEDLRAALAEYKRYRTTTGPFNLRVTMGTWDLHVTRLQRFYKWALASQLVDAEPFSYSGSGHNHARSHGQKDNVAGRTLQDEELIFFLRVAAGLTPDGEQDASASRREYLYIRNAAAAHLLVGTGCRRQEFGCLTVWELPAAPPPSTVFVPLVVPGSIAKRGKRRTTIAFARDFEHVDRSDFRHLGKVLDYVRNERAEVLTGRWSPAEALYVERVHTDALTLRGHGKVKFEKLTPGERHRLVDPDGNSPLVFLTERGHPFWHEKQWNAVFNDIAADCRRWRPQFPSVTPHWQRHAFARRTLQMFQYLRVVDAQDVLEIAGGDPGLAHAARKSDPWLVLKDYMGHDRLESTMKYVKTLDHSEAVSRAILAGRQHRSARSTPS